MEPREKEVASVSRHPLSGVMPVAVGMLLIIIAGSLVIRWQNRDQTVPSGSKQDSIIPNTVQTLPLPGWSSYIDSSGFLIDHPKEFTVTPNENDGSVAFGDDIIASWTNTPYTACEGECPKWKSRTVVQLARRECAVVHFDEIAESGTVPNYFYECPHDGRFFRLTYRPSDGVESQADRQVFDQMARSVAFQ